MILEQFDELEGYCRMLGHYLPFQYCRTQQSGLPCSKILDCYFERIPIREFMDANFSPTEQKQIFSESSPKLQSILELVEQAKQRLERR